VAERERRSKVIDHRWPSDHLERIRALQQAAGSLLLHGRYIAGEFRQVWMELAALGDSCEAWQEEHAGDNERPRFQMPISPPRRLKAGISVEGTPYAVTLPSGTLDAVVENEAHGVSYGISFGFNLITNADTGVILSWGLYYLNVAITGPSVLMTSGLAITNGTSVSLASGPVVPGQLSQVTPVLQAEDGSFVGTVAVPGTGGNNATNMVAFDASGSVRWMVPNETPQIATAGGGVIGQSGITYDQNGNATGQGTLYTQSWTYNMYQDGPVTQVAAV
jgi:hypothetical protein